MGYLPYQLVSPISSIISMLVLGKETIFFQPPLRDCLDTVWARKLRQMNLKIAIKVEGSKELTPQQNSRRLPPSSVVMNQLSKNLGFTADFCSHRKMLSFLWNNSPYICNKFEPNSRTYFIDMVHLRHVKIKGFSPGQMITTKKKNKNQRVVISFWGRCFFC